LRRTASGRPLENTLLQLLVVVACVLGFWAPWDSYLGGGPRTLTWLYLPGLLVRSMRQPFSSATMIVTFSAVLLTAAGALLRLWSESVPRESSGGVPNQRTQFSRAAGTMLFSLGLAILMPPSGAGFFLVSLLLVQLRELSSGIQRATPSALSGNRAVSMMSRWKSALIAETFPLAYSICLVGFAWQYNPNLLLRCLLVCLGLSLITRALLPRGPDFGNQIEIF
jgi:hypothetical protein